jgi:DNA-binding NarL/FixJ family response regulator
MDSIRVLLIGDNQPLLDLIRLFLEQHGDVFIVGMCADPKAELVQISRYQPEVVICDLGTPGLTGLATISGLHTMMPEVAIIATTLLRANGYQDVALSAGAEAVIPQAELNTRLLPAVERVARTSRSPNGGSPNGATRQ